MKPNKVERYPLDFEALQKGTWLEGIELEKAIGKTHTEAERALKMMALVSQIEKQTDPTILARVDHDRIRLMSDEEALEYVPRMWDRRYRSMNHNVWRLGQIDRSELTANQNAELEFKGRMMLAVTQAARNERKKQMRMQLAAERTGKPKKQIA